VQRAVPIATLNPKLERPLSSLGLHISDHDPQNIHSSILALNVPSRSELLFLQRQFPNRVASKSSNSLPYQPYAFVRHRNPDQENKFSSSASTLHALKQPGTIGLWRRRSRLVSDRLPDLSARVPLAIFRPFHNLIHRPCPTATIASLLQRHLVDIVSQTPSTISFGCCCVSSRLC
jgi:hypothetical protein